jgi:hypothetical protein
MPGIKKYIFVNVVRIIEACKPTTIYMQCFRYIVTTKCSGRARSVGLG